MKLKLTRSLKRAVVASLLIIGLSPFVCPADLFSGSLTNSSGIDAVGNWTTGLTISWTVKQAGSAWSYHYALTVDKDDKALSHIIFEVSDTFKVENLLGVAGELKLYTPGGSNEGMPDDLYGIKFEGFADGGTVSDDTTKTWFVDFTSDRAPVWGDFYAVDGKGKDSIAYAYNKGFTLNDVDEMTNHIAVPDTLSYVPVPGAMLLGALGLGAAGLRLHRRV